MRFTKMTLTETEIRTVYVVFYELMKIGYSRVNQFLGSLTIKEMRTLVSKIRCADYCERNGIAFEDMGYADFEEAMMEIAREDGYEV